MSAYYSNTPEGNDSSNNGSHNNSPFSNPTTKWIIGGVLVASLTLGGLFVLGNQLNSNNKSNAVSSSVSLKSLVPTSTKSSSSIATSSTVSSSATSSTTASSSASSSSVSSSTPGSSVAASSSSSVAISSPAKTTHTVSDFPTFSFDYDNMWAVETVVNNGNSTPSTQQGKTIYSKGVVLTKKNNGTVLNLNLQRNSPFGITNPGFCFDSTQAVEVGNDWYRARNSDNYRGYAKLRDSTNVLGISFKSNDYSHCPAGTIASGYFLNKASDDSYLSTSISIVGEDRSVADEIVKSIKF